MLGLTSCYCELSLGDNQKEGGLSKDIHLGLWGIIGRGLGDSDSGQTRRATCQRAGAQGASSCLAFGQGPVLPLSTCRVGGGSARALLKGMAAFGAGLGVQTGLLLGGGQRDLL